MALIINEIPAQNFEKIRDKITEILTIELESQFNITSNQLFNAKIFPERFYAFDKEELPAIRVYLDRVDYTSNDPDNARFDGFYNIEVHTKAKNTAAKRGDLQASTDCHKLLGVIRYIFSNPNYLRLQFEDLNIILQNNSVTGLQIAQPTQNEGIQTVAGVLTLRVNSIENNGQLTSAPLEGTDSDIGTKLTVNN